MASIPIPEGFTPPQGNPGEPFDVAATVRVAGQSLEILSIDGIPLGAPAAPQGGPPMPEETPEDFIGAVDKGMVQMGFR